LKAKKSEWFMENRCKTCLMPGCAVKLKGDACEYCSPDDKRPKAKTSDIIPNDNEGLSIEDLKELTRLSTGKYDCLVGISGGRDSTFLLYYTKEILGFKPLAVNYNNGFLSPEAQANQQNIVKTLGGDFVQFRLDWNFLKKLYRGFFLHYGEFCSPCHKLHFYVMAKFAKDNGIRLELRGLSSKVETNQIDPDYFDFFCKSEEEFNEKVLSFANEENITDEELEFHKEFLYTEPWACKDVKVIDLPDLLDYKYQDVQKILTEKFNWTHPPGQFIHGDCLFDPLLIYLCHSKYGYSEKQTSISNLLIHGDIDTERAKELLLTEECASISEIRNFDELLRTLDIDRPAFEKIAATFWKPPAGKTV
jgi:hypothetical protein